MLITFKFSLYNQIQKCTPYPKLSTVNCNHKIYVLS